MKIADLHCDTISRIYKTPASVLRRNEFQLDLERMKAAGYLLQNFALFVDLKKEDCPYDACKKQAAVFHMEMEQNQDLIRPVTTYKEILENEKLGKMSALITIEEGQVCKGNLQRLKEFYDLGVRMMTFTWNYPNTLGSPAEPVRSAVKGGGLTHLGIAFLDAMEQLGIIPDVSHLSDRGIRDVCHLAKKPFVASHSNARSLCSRNRNLPEELIQEIAKKGGVIGVNFYGPFLTPVPNADGCFYSYAADIAKHIQYLTNTGGISCVGLGSDFDGMDDNPGLADCSHMEELEHQLRKIGFHESEIEKIFFGNVLELYKELL